MYSYPGHRAAVISSPCIPLHVPPRLSCHYPLHGAGVLNNIMCHCSTIPARLACYLKYIQSCNLICTTVALFLLPISFHPSLSLSLCLHIRPLPLPIPPSLLFSLPPDLPFHNPPSPSLLPSLSGRSPPPMFPLPLPSPKLLQVNKQDILLLDGRDRKKVMVPASLQVPLLPSHPWLPATCYLHHLQ